MEFEYTEKIIDIIRKAEETNREKIVAAAERFAECIENDGIMYVFGTGHAHIVGIDLFYRAGGIANIQAMLDPDAMSSLGVMRSSRTERISGLADIIYDSYGVRKGDIMMIVSNSGRNVVPIEMALRCRKEGIYTIALTNISQSLSQQSRHKDGKRLCELCDLAIDTCVPFGDATIDVGGKRIGAASTIASCCLGNTIVTEAAKIVHGHGKEFYSFESCNVSSDYVPETPKAIADRLKHS